MIRTAIAFIILSVVGFFLQGSFITHLLPFLAAPDFILILVIWVSLSNEDATALFVSFLLGLFSDFASGLYLGPQAAGCVLACVLIKGISRHVYADRFLSIVTVTILASFAKQIVARSLVLAFIGFKAFDELGLSTLISQALLTGLLAPIFLRFVLSGRRRKVARSQVR